MVKCWFSIKKNLSKRDNFDSTRIYMSETKLLKSINENSKYLYKISADEAKKICLQSNILQLKKISTLSYERESNNLMAPPSIATAKTSPCWS